MIKQNELRIGNWIMIYASGQPPMAYQVTRHDLYTKSHPDLYLSFQTPHRVEGISLTPEILEKCGFIDPANNGLAYRRSIYKMDELCLYVSEGFIRYQTQGSGFTSDFNNTCKNLHQLQNLYFALTGEDLEIKL